MQILSVLVVKTKLHSYNNSTCLSNTRSLHGCFARTCVEIVLCFLYLFLKSSSMFSSAHITRVLARKQIKCWFPNTHTIDNCECIYVRSTIASHQTRINRQPGVLNPVGCCSVSFGRSPILFSFQRFSVSWLRPTIVPCLRRNRMHFPLVDIPSHDTHSINSILCCKEIVLPKRWQQWMRLQHDGEPNR